MRAYSILDIKDLSDNAEFVTVKGIASTPTTDRQGDKVDPMGAKFVTPMPLLLYHNDRMPVGNLIFAKPTESGIPFEAKIPKVAEEGTVKERVNEAIHSLKYNLISAVSIGFTVLRVDLR